MFEINVFSVFVATFFAIALGIVWYSPWVFGRVWMHLVGLSESDLEVPGQWKRMILGGISHFCFFYVIAGMLTSFANSSQLSLYSVTVPLTVGILALISGPVIWERRSVVYFLITGGYAVLSVTSGMYIIALWPW